MPGPDISEGGTNSGQFYPILKNWPKLVKHFPAQAIRGGRSRFIHEFCETGPQLFVILAKFQAFNHHPCEHGCLFL